MHLIPRLAWSLLSCLPMTAALAETNSQLALRHQCSEAFFTQIEVKACLEKALTSSTQALQKAEAAMEQALKNWDQDPRYIQTARKHLKAAHREFMEYRSQQCSLLSAINGGAAGNAFELRRLACTAELNNRRAAQLQEVVQEIVSAQ